jgi:hypothetical protein
MRRIVFGVLASGFLFSANSAALASAGCTALNGAFTGGAVSGSTSGTGFSVGDTITLTVTAAGGGDALGLYDNTSHSPLLLSTNAVGTRTYVVSADTADNFIISGTQANAGSNFSWSCTAGGGSKTGTTDSQKLTNVQTQGSTVVSNTSGANISGSVNGAIDNALGQQSTAPSQTTSVAGLSRSEFAEIDARQSAGLAWKYLPSWSQAHLIAASGAYYDAMTRSGYVAVRAGSGYVWQTPSQRFAAEQPSTLRSRADEAFTALGYAAVNKAPPLAAPVFAPQWSTWADVRGSGFEQSDSSVLKGTQVNATAGLNYKVTPNLVLGLFGGYESFDYEFASLTGKLKGDGGTVGTYAGWQITPTLRWKGMVGWTGLGYDATAGAAAGSFDGSRWLFSTGLSGSYRVAAYIIEPSADVFAIWERQTAYTDTLGALHDARSFSTGRVSLGGKAIAPQWVAGVAPYLGFYGDWRFSSDNALPAAAPFTGIGDGWSARVTGGLNMRVFTTGSLALGGEYGGIGADYKLWTGNVRLTMPF